MKVAFTITKKNIDELDTICDKITYTDKREQSPQAFHQFIIDNIKNQIYIKNFQDIGLQLAQMAPALEVLVRHEKALYFLEKGFATTLSDIEYTYLLLEHAKNEKKVMSFRTQAGIKIAQANGVQYGRPRIKPEVIERIQYLSKNQGRSVREIAEMCEVSIGTVHKYANID